MDLRNGIVEINEIKLTSHTTQSEFEELFSNHVFKPRSSNKNLSSGIFDNYGPSLPYATCGEILDARIKICFSEEKIKYIEIISAEYGGLPKSKEQDEEQQVFYREWLEKQLGKPDFRRPNEIKYVFDWGNIAASRDYHNLTTSIFINFN